MSDLLGHRLLRSLRTLFRGTSANGLSDADLLDRFVQTGDEEAFELLLWRYAAMVLNVCWQVLRDEQAVEDAFQATFLVLVRKAKAISRREALPGWLYRVAHRIALRAREQRVVETERQQTGFDLDTAPGNLSQSPVDGELSRLLHEEVSHLPARYRVPIVCCYLQGQTYAEVAKQLGWREGTVAGRMARARELLRKRLARRGVTLGVVGVAAHLTAGACEAARWSRRVTGFLQGLRALASNNTAAAGLSSHAAALAEGVILQMFWSKLKGTAVAMLAFVSLVGLGAAVAGLPGREKAAKPPEQAEQRAEAAEKPARAPAKAADPLDEAARRLRVRNHFKILGLAMHNYNDTFRHLPQPALAGKDGKPLLSWRVAILPFIAQDTLYKQFKLEESWDSPHNKKLIAKMPDLFASVQKDAKPGRTTIQYLVGPGTVFPSKVFCTRPGIDVPGIPGGLPGGLAPPKPVGGAAGMALGIPSIPASIPDGTSNTLLLVEARDPVIWTRPDDIAYDAKKPIPPLGDASSVVFHATFADGSARALPKRMDEMTLRALITPNGGEVVDHSKLALDGSAGNTVRREALGKLKKRNDQLKQDVKVLREILTELKEELIELRWTLDKEKLLALDPAATKLNKENEQLEKALKETRDDARKLVAEVEKLKKELRKKQEK